FGEREPAVAADVDEAAQDAVAIARDDDRRAAHVAGEVARLRELPRVPDVLPRRAEDPLSLEPQDLGIRVPTVRQGLVHARESSGARDGAPCDPGAAAVRGRSGAAAAAGPGAAARGR